MKYLAGLLFGLIFLLHSSSNIFALMYEAPGERIPTPIQIQIVNTCVVTGCSNQLCVSSKTGPIYSTCEWKEEYACLPSAKCELQQNGSCGWTYTDEYKACSGTDSTILPTPTPTSTCGNLTCDPGEADTISGGCGENASSLCLGPPQSIILGTCPSDCVSESVQPVQQTVTPTAFIEIKPTNSVSTVTPTSHILTTITPTPTGISYISSQSILSEKILSVTKHSEQTFPIINNLQSQQKFNLLQTIIRFFPLLILRISF